MARKNITRRPSRFPRCIQRMIELSYRRGERSHDAVERINGTAIATKMGITLKVSQVAAAYGWLAHNNETRHPKS